jgi:hypothetical protein
VTLQPCRYEYWRGLPIWRLFECAYILCGWEPPKWREFDPAFEGLESVAEAKSIREVYDHLKRFASAGELDFQSVSITRSSGSQPVLPDAVMTAGPSTVFVLPQVEVSSSITHEDVFALRQLKRDNALAWALGRGYEIPKSLQSEAFVFRHTAKGWEIGPESEPTIIRSNARGFRFYLKLIERAKSDLGPISTFDLEGVVNAYWAESPVHTELSMLALQDLRAKQNELGHLLEDPDSKFYYGENEIQKFVEERSEISKYLSSTFDRKGRERDDSSEVSKSRQRTKNALYEARKLIDEEHPKVADLLKRRTTGGIDLEYLPHIDDPEWVL